MSLEQARLLLGKAEEYLGAATRALADRRVTAATSLAIHAACSAADAVTGLRLGRRAADQDPAQTRALLRDCGEDGIELDQLHGRLLAMKEKAETEPEVIPGADAERAVERANRCVAVARRLLRGTED